MARATDIVVTHSEHAQDRMALEAEITRLHGHPPVAWCNHLWNGLDVYSPTGTRREPVEYLSGLPVIARFGVARPDGPRQTAVAAGATIVKEIRAADHAPVGPDELQTIEHASADADALLVTGKDWAKLRRVVNLERLGIEVIVPDLGLDFVQGESLLVERLLQAASSEHL
jgi:tetraacyldisaccharide-1-P 4'-kinase